MTVYQLTDIREYVYRELDKKIDFKSYDRLQSKYSNEHAKLVELLTKALNRYTNCGVSINRHNQRSRYGILNDMCEEITLKISLDKTLQNWDSIQIEIEKGAKKLHSALKDNLKETKKELAQIKQAVRVIIKKLK